MKIAARLNKMLSKGISGNQEQLVELLRQEGISTTQSTISRALKKINAVRGADENGNTIYSLPDAVQAPRETGFLDSLALSVRDNGQLIVIRTKPGTANAVAKFIDDHGFDELLGTVAGDDTIMIAPVDTSQTSRITRKIGRYLKSIGIF